MFSKWFVYCVTSGVSYYLSHLFSSSGWFWYPGSTIWEPILAANMYCGWIYIYINIYSAGANMMQKKAGKKDQKRSSPNLHFKSMVNNPPETQQKMPRIPRTLGYYSLLGPLQASQVAFQWTAQLCWGVGSCGGLLGGWKAFWISIESKISWDLSQFKFVFSLEFGSLLGFDQWNLARRHHWSLIKMYHPT